MVANRYTLNKLVDHETRNEYQTDIANRFSALEDLEISSENDTWVKIKESIKATPQEKVRVLETHSNKPWFDQECSELANKRNSKIIWQKNPKEKKMQKILVMLGVIPVERSRNRRVVK